MSRHSALGQRESAGALQPITPTSRESATWDGGTWIGQVDYDELVDASVELVGGNGFHRARLLVWKNDQPCGSVDVPVTDGTIDLADVRRLATDLPYLPPRTMKEDRPPISVVICTRDRPDHLPNVLGSFYGLEYPVYEILVVDNNPASGLTPPVLAGYADLPIRLIDAVGQGLSIARNVGLRNARYNIVAFTDDDVVLDRRWLTNIAEGFARDSTVACVCGMVPTSELLTPAQAYFDQRVGWAERWVPAVYSLAGEPPDSLFPLRVSEFGTGANFAVNRDLAIALGGFDEALGAGAPTGAGEDSDMFVRMLVAGHGLAREPSAIVWHSHRKTPGELEGQMFNYGVGLSAGLLKLMLHPRTFPMVVSRLVVGARHFRNVTVVDHEEALAAEPSLKGIERRERAGICRGPWALLRGRLAGRTARPLAASPHRLRRAFDFRGGQMWGEPGNSILAGRLAATGVALGAIGSAGAIGALPSALSVALIGAFVLGGPGSVALSFYPDLPRYAIVALVPVIGVATVILAVTGLLMIGFYSPVTVLLGLTLTTVTAGLGRCARLASRQRSRV